jgi:hypothetical protein
MQHWLVISNIFFDDFPYRGNVIIPTDSIIFFTGIFFSNHRPEHVHPKLGKFVNPTWSSKNFDGRRAD